MLDALTARIDLSRFHPDLRIAAALLPRHVVGPRSLTPLRAAMRPLERRRPDDVEVVDLGTASVRVHRPRSGRTGERRPALLWIHGGGMVIGTAAQDDPIGRVFAQDLDAIVVSVEYRLAPEHPFPAPLDDCATALAWLAEHPEVDPDRIAIGGGSAGGGLAAALALRTRDEGALQPVLQLLVYPMLDDRSALRRDVDERWFRLWDVASNEFGWRSYLGVAPGTTEVPEHSVPARAADPGGLPPAWIGVSSLDLFHDEDVAYAAALRDAGVECALEVVEGAFHGFDMVVKADVVRRFHQTQVEALRTAFAR